VQFIFNINTLHKQIDDRKLQRPERKYSWGAVKQMKSFYDATTISSRFFIVKRRRIKIRQLKTAQDKLRKGYDR